MGALVVVAVAVVDELAVGSSCCLPMVAVVAVVDVELAPLFMMVGW